MAWDSNRPVPWHRLIREWLIYVAIMVVIVFVAVQPSSRVGAFAGLSHHLALRGKKLWYGRRPEEALGCFLLSREYLELSIRRGYRFSQPQEFRERRAILKFYIKSLQDGKIRPDLPEDILNRFPRPDDVNQE